MATTIATAEAATSVGAVVATATALAEVATMAKTAAAVVAKTTLASAMLGQRDNNQLKAAAEETAALAMAVVTETVTTMEMAMVMAMTTMQMQSMVNRRNKDDASRKCLTAKDHTVTSALPHPPLPPQLLLCRKVWQL